MAQLDSHIKKSREMATRLAHHLSDGHRTPCVGLGTSKLLEREVLRRCAGRAALDCARMSATRPRSAARSARRASRATSCTSSRSCTTTSTPTSRARAGARSRRSGSRRSTSSWCTGRSLGSAARSLCPIRPSRAPAACARRGARWSGSSARAQRRRLEFRRGAAARACRRRPGTTRRSARARRRPDRARRPRAAQAHRPSAARRIAVTAWGPPPRARARARPRPPASSRPRAPSTSRRSRCAGTCSAASPSPRRRRRARPRESRTVDARHQLSKTELAAIDACELGRRLDLVGIWPSARCARSRGGPVATFLFIFPWFRVDVPATRRAAERRERGRPTASRGASRPRRARPPPAAGPPPAAQPPPAAVPPPAPQPPPAAVPSPTRRRLSKSNRARGRSALTRAGCAARAAPCHTCGTARSYASARTTRRTGGSARSRSPLGTTCARSTRATHTRTATRRARRRRRSGSR